MKFSQRLLNINSSIISLLSQERDITPDVMKGIGMLLVLLGHASIASQTGLKTIIFSFHMPLFFLISGYYHKKVNYKKLASSLLLPYIITSLITVLLFSSYSDVQGVFEKTLSIFFPRGCSSKYIEWYHLKQVIGVIWFLPALFWCKIFFDTILKYNTLTHFHIFIISGVIAYLFIFIHNYILVLPLGICEGAQALLIYSVGYILHHIENKRNYKSILIPICLFIWGYCCIFSHVDMAKCEYGFFVVDMIGACGAIYLTYIVSKNIKGKYIIKFLAIIGNISLLILCTHNVMFIFCKMLKLPYVINATISIIYPLIYTTIKRKQNVTIS